MKQLLLLFLLFSMQTAIAESQWDEATLELSQASEIKVYRSPDCQCCHRWIAHLQQHDFKVIDIIMQDLSTVKEKAGVPAVMGSCHTALVDGYVIEGHVPADDIKRLLIDKPDLLGLSVPRMPVGTPGMEMGERQDDFAVISFDKAGQYRIFNRYQVDANKQYQSVPAEN